MQHEAERAEVVASYAYLANDAPARVPMTESGGGRGGSGWPQGNGAPREGSLQAVSPLEVAGGGATVAAADRPSLAGPRTECDKSEPQQTDAAFISC